MDSTVNAVCMFCFVALVLLCLLELKGVAVYYSWQWPRIPRLHSLKDWMVSNLVKCRLSNLELIYLLYMVCIPVFSVYIHGILCSDLSKFICLLGDNFFKPASYTIEAMCAKSYEETTERLKEIESKILEKRNDLRQFETEYRKVSSIIFVTNITIM
jgi:hypothetical protein